MSQIIACRREEPETLLACANRAVYYEEWFNRTEWDAHDVRVFVEHARQKAQTAANKGSFSVVVPLVALERMGEHIDLVSPPAAVIEGIRKDDPTLRVRFIAPDWKTTVLRYALLCSFCGTRDAYVNGAYVLEWRPIDSATKA